ncbi:hypothetical protein [Streptomyces guryensis]|uniref:Uncharacterized protein n=1 Tax=Streptomyces guryensis TaxID=2886947 RepID=A0A9Q3VW77_9ACTN|nr:hypothetical protein [Streptomyces guryensis]MCD9879699.1 hypothetical protein [Streptomyces guryensis]
MTSIGHPRLGSRLAVIKARLQSWVRGHSETWQFAVGHALAFPFVSLQLVMVMIGSGVGAVICLVLSSVACVAAGWLMRPWFEGLPRKEQRRITTVPLFGYLGMVTLFVFCCLWLAPQERGVASMLLFLVWTYHSLYGSAFEPSGFAYERLRGRLRRAAPVRVAVIWCGMAGLFFLLQGLRERSEYKTVVFGTMVTLSLAGIAASLKVFTRVRRLSTSLDLHTDKLVIELEKLRTLPQEKRAEQQIAVESAWRDLRRVLVNKIDTGFSISGVFVLPQAALRELRDDVHRAQRAAGSDFAAHRSVIAKLRMIRIACAGGTDTLA